MQSRQRRTDPINVRSVAMAWLSMLPLRHRSLLRVGLSAALVAGCAGPSVTAPPASAAPSVVLETYLRAFEAGDCGAGRQMWQGSGAGGDLCGATALSAYQFTGPPATPSPTEVEYAVELTTTGTGDGSVQAGQTLWFFQLDRQADGSWRITQAGSGP
jgi:hypothetical protein